MQGRRKTHVSQMSSCWSATRMENSSFQTGSVLSDLTLVRALLLSPA